jgi:hypothetical protein
MALHEVNGVVVVVYGAALDVDRLSELLRLPPRQVQASAPRTESELDLDGSVFDSEISGAWRFNTFGLVRSRELRAHVQHVVDALSELPQACVEARADGQRLDIEFVGAFDDALPDSVDDLIGIGLLADLKRLGLGQMSWRLHERP